MNEEKTINPSIIFKRIEQVKDELNKRLDQISKSMNDNSKETMLRVHNANINALVANRNSVATRHFQYAKKLLDKKEYIDFCESNEFVRTFNKEITVLQQLINDILVTDSTNFKELDFLKEKNKIRTIEIFQAQVDRLKLNIADLESIPIEEEKIKPLRENLEELEKTLKKEFEELSTKKTNNKEHYLKKKDAEEAISKLLDDKREDIIERFRTLPLVNITTHLEPNIRELLSEARIEYSLECYNSCIISCCVIIEAVLKDVIKLKENKREVELNFNDLINHCVDKEYIKENEKLFLEGVKDQYRNPYVHSNLSKIIPKVVMKGVEITGNKVSDVKLITETDAPVMRQLVKKTKDEASAHHLYGETLKFLKNISETHFNFDKK